MGVLTKEVVIDKIETYEDGMMRVREVTRILEDGVIIPGTSSYTNSTLIEPGQDVSKETQRVRDIAAAVHKPEVISAYTAKIAAKQAEEAAKQAGTEEPK